MRRIFSLWIAFLLTSCAAQPAAPARREVKPAYKPPAQVTHVIDPVRLSVSALNPHRYPITGTGGVLLGRRHGSWSFEQQGQIVAFGAYAHGLRQGYWSFGPLHAPIAKGRYVDDQPHGLWRFRCINAVAPWCEAQFDHGRQLSWQAQASSHSLRYTLLATDEERMWRLSAHDAQGQLRQEVSLKLATSPTSWAPHQSASFRAQLYPQSLSALAQIACHGHARTYDAQGQLLSERHCVHGQPHGVSRAFYPDAPGQLERFEEYEEGLLHGQRRLYDRAGEPIAIERWQRGVRHGLWQRWRAGVLIEELEYERDALVGRSRHFYDDGMPRAVRHWRAGALYGPAKDWHPNGHLWASRRYAYGRLDGDFALYHPNGQKLVQGQWRYGRPVGRWRGWFERGQARFDGEFFDQREVKRCQILYEKRRIQCTRPGGNGPACHLRYNPVTRRFDLPQRRSVYFPCTGIVGELKPGWRWWDERGKPQPPAAPLLLDTPAQQRMAKYEHRCEHHRELPEQVLDAKHQALAKRTNHEQPSWHEGYLSPSYARCLAQRSPLF